jgi:predicted RND superfamily exporter protein
MTIQEITNYIDKKINENESFIRITFFEIRVKYGLSEKETDTFLELAKNKFENMGYNVYFTGAKFIYDNSNRTVQPNELMIAIKD